MITLTVDLGARSYPIHIGTGLLGEAALLEPGIGGRQVMLVSNEAVAPLYLNRVCGALASYQCVSVVLPDGEQHKTLRTVGTIFDALMEHRFERGCTLIALGGGVVGDLTGFAAACYQRGVAYIQVPTTLLAQVDSSVGGKTGVNHPGGKNMIGAFHQPSCVLADTATLRTLPERELVAGLAEVIKYGLIGDAPFFAWLEDNMDRLRGLDSEALRYAIERSCRNKARIVAMDERESGVRALLNLGHTFGHAIEAGHGYGEWLHGEAVAVGIIMAADLSNRLGWLPGADLARITRLVAAAGLPLAPPPTMSPEAFLDLMGVDKKVRDGRLRLVLLRGIGEAVISDGVPHDVLSAALHHASATDAR